MESMNTILQMSLDANKKSIDIVSSLWNILDAVEECADDMKKLIDDPYYLPRACIANPHDLLKDARTGLKEIWEKSFDAVYQSRVGGAA